MAARSRGLSVQVLRQSRINSLKPGEGNSAMHEINVLLGEVKGLGRVRLCECNSVHLSVGPVTINLEPAAFYQMTHLLTTAAERLTKIAELSREQPEAVVM
jgi:hypothetical protein